MEDDAIAIELKTKRKQVQKWRFRALERLKKKYGQQANDRARIHRKNGQLLCVFFSSRRRHTRCSRDWSSDVCSSDLSVPVNRSNTTAYRRHARGQGRSEEHTSELQSRLHLVCRLLLEKKNTKHRNKLRVPRNFTHTTTAHICTRV